LRIPKSVKVLGAYDLDVLYSHSSARADALVILESGGRTVAAVVEDTGRPNIDDLNRLNGTADDLRRRGLIRPGMVTLKILHHGGIRSGRALLTSLARSLRVELQECRSGATDIGFILRRRGLL